MHMLIVLVFLFVLVLDNLQGVLLMAAMIERYNWRMAI